MTVEFASSATLKDRRREEVLTLLAAAFDSTVHASNVDSAFFSGFVPSHPNLVLLTRSGHVVAFAATAARVIRVGGVDVRALTVGPLAVHPSAQGSGIGRQLMAGVEGLARSSHAEAIYLQGIPGFYRQFGYHQMLERSKVTLPTEELPRPDALSVRAMEDADLPHVRDLFARQAAGNSWTSVRSDAEWEWLTRFARRSYYFYDPMVVQLNGDVVAYFTHDPVDPGRIREAVYPSGSEGAGWLLRGIASHAMRHQVPRVDVMAPLNSGLVRYVRSHGRGEFTQILQSDGGQLIKLMDAAALLGRVLTATGTPYRSVSSLDSGRVYVEGAQVVGGRIEHEHLSVPESRLAAILSGSIESGDPESQVEFGGASIELALSTLAGDVPFVYQGDNL